MATKFLAVAATADSRPECECSVSGNDAQPPLSGLECRAEARSVCNRSYWVRERSIAKVGCCVWRAADNESKRVCVSRLL